MIRITDPTYFLGSGLVAMALVVAVATVVRGELPLLGDAVGPLLAVAVIGIALVGLAIVIAAKWLLATAMAAVAR